jgi:predicted RNA-binding protein YlxR (DUF448 family)
VRVVADAEGRLAIGRTLAGRGAWLCAGSVSCLNTAVGRKAFSRALRVEVPAAASDAFRIDFVRSADRVRG